MNVCPECDCPLAQTATSCKCGWVLPTEGVTDTIHCSHCAAAARMRIQSDAGWENVCDVHYDEHFSKLAAGAFSKRGLERRPEESIDAWRKRVLAWLKDHAVVKKFGKAA